MLRPAQMVKVHLTGLHRELEATVEALEGLRLIHIVEAETLEEGFSSGKPLGYGPRVSEQLLEVRGLAKVLELRGGDPSRPHATDRLGKELADQLATIGAPVKALHRRLAGTSKELEEKRQLIQRLEPFQGLGLDLSHLTGYHSLEVLVGTLGETGRSAVAGSGFSGEMLTTEQLVVLFVPRAELDTVEPLLSRHGLKVVELPAPKGDPDDLRRETLHRVRDLEAELTALESDREALAARHGPWLAAAEEYLTIEAGKSELPLSLTTSEHAFLLEGWVPVREVARLQRALKGLEVHLEQGTPPARETEHARPEADARARSPVPPVKLENPRLIRPMEFITKLFATPRHNELDPTAFIFITLPLFFGLMVSDAGYGLIYMLLGYWVYTRMAHSRDLVMLGKIIFIGGLWAFIFGSLLFTEAFGMHFSEILERFGYHTDWHTFPIFDKFNREHGYFNDGSVDKLLIICLVLGIAHMSLAFILGLVNVGQAHGLSHGLLEKGSWLVILWAMVLLIPFYFLHSGSQRVAHLGLGLLAVGCVMLLKGEGPLALMEIFSVISNGLSYLRLVAVGLADAALASLVNSLSGEMFVTGGVSLPLGILLWVVGHLGIVLLGLLGSGINALRLQYVEFFPKFFEGGGEDYAPFGFQRTLISTPTTMEAN